MKGTGFLPTAYHENMEPIILIFLLAVMGKNSSELKDSLVSALKFYRENRELIALFSQMAKGTSDEAESKSPQHEEPQEKNGKERTDAQQKSRSEETGSYRLIDEFLKTHSV